MGGRQHMITDTSTMVLVTAVTSAIMALYGAVAGIFYDGGDEDTENTVWYWVAGIPMAVAIGINFPWIDRGAEIFYGSVNPIMGFVLWYAPALSVLLSCALAWTISFLFFNRKRRLPTVGSYDEKVAWPDRPHWAPRKRH